MCKCTIFWQNTNKKLTLPKERVKLAIERETEKVKTDHPVVPDRIILLETT